MSDEGVLVKLDLSNIEHYFNNDEPFQCMFVELANVPTIREFCKYLRRKLNIDTKVNVYCDQKFLIPSDEMARILTRCDVVTVRARRKKRPPSVSSEDNVVDQVPAKRRRRDGETDRNGDADSGQANNGVDGSVVASTDEDDVNGGETATLTATNCGEEMSVGSAKVAVESAELEPARVSSPARKKRKRKRKNKNKNRLEDEFVAPPAAKSDDIFAAPAKKSKAGVPKHIYFDSSEEGEGEEETSSKTGGDISPKSAGGGEDFVAGDENPAAWSSIDRVVSSFEKSSRHVSCEEVLLAGDGAKKKKTTAAKRINNGDKIVDLSALLSLAQSTPVITSRKKVANGGDVYSNKSVVLKSSSDPNFAGDIFPIDGDHNFDGLDAYEGGPKIGRKVAFKSLQLGPDYTPEYVQFAGEIVSAGDGDKVRILVVFDAREGRRQVDKFRVDDVVTDSTLKNKDVEFAWSALTEIKRIDV